MKIKPEKINLLEKPKEIKHIKCKNDYLTKNYNNKYLENDKLPILLNNHQLSEINIEKIKQQYLNHIHNEEIINNNIFNLENEMIHINNKNDLNLPRRIIKYNINQIPEKIKEQNKINLNDKMIISNNLACQSTNFSSIINSKKDINIPEIKFFSPELNLIEIQPKIKKINYLERPLELKKILLNSEGIIKKPLIKKEIKENNIISSEYLIHIPKIYLPSKIKNIINNEKIVSNNIFSPLLKVEEYKYKEYHTKNKFEFQTDIALNLNQNPEKLKKPKLINVENITEEINIEHIRPSKILKRKITKENIEKEEISQDLNNIKKIFKKQINKINIRDKFFISDNYVDIFKTNYENNIFQNKGNKCIHNIIKNKFDINPIKLDIKKLKPEKINSNEYPKEIQKINIKPDYYNKIFENNPHLIEDKLQILSSNYQITSFIPMNEHTQKKINILRSKKNPKLIKILDEPKEIIINKLRMNNPIKREKEKSKNFIINDEIYNDINNIKKNLPKKLLKHIENKNENKKINNDSTLFKFYDSDNKQLALFNFSSISQSPTNTEEQKQFFNSIHKKFVAFKLFNMKNKFDPRKKWFIIWNKKSKK